jgi:hypothetical protein
MEADDESANAPDGNLLATFQKILLPDQEGVTNSVIVEQQNRTCR